jgi:glycosyltransferase involved in cell wall biosynthesis
MPNLRICTLLESYYPVVGGMETQAKNLSASLKKKGVQQIIVTRRTSPDLASFENVDGVPVYRVSPTGRSSRFRWIFMLTCLSMLIRKRKEYDILLVSGFRVLGISGVIISKLIGKKCVLKAECIGELSGEFFTGGLASMKLKRSQGLIKFMIGLRNKILLKADLFISMYSEMTDEFVEYGVDRQNTTVIPNSVDNNQYSLAASDEKESLRESLGLPKDHKIAIYTGRIVSYKGVPSLLEVWNELRQEYNNISLVICGSGGVDIYACEEEMHCFVKDNQMEDVVRFTGSVSNIAEYLRASDIFVLPTENDAFPLCLLEAMACGMPIITTTVGALKDVIEHKRNGIVMTPGSKNELRDSLVTLLNDEKLCDAIGKNAMNDVRNNYTLDIVAQMYVDLFNKCLENKVQ